MRCFGRLVLFAILLAAAAAGWFYRDEVRRWVDQRFRPTSAAARIGRPSPAALHAAMARLDSLLRPRQDSVVLTPSEMASLLVRGTTFVPGVTLDSITVELGDRTVRVRALVDSVSIPASWRALIPGRPAPNQEVVIRGTLTPVHAGLAEFELQHVSVHGIPLPSEVIARMATHAAGRGSDGRLDVVLPQTVGGFRIRPTGVAIYRQGVMP